MSDSEGTVTDAQVIDLNPPPAPPDTLTDNEALGAREAAERCAAYLESYLLDRCQREADKVTAALLQHPGNTTVAKECAARLVKFGEFASYATAYRAWLDSRKPVA